MYIQLRIKTKEELTEEFPTWLSNRYDYADPLWKLRRLSSYVGSNITDRLPKLYKTFEDVPEIINLAGYELHKKFLDWRPSEIKGSHRIANGLQRI